MVLEHNAKLAAMQKADADAGHSIPFRVSGLVTPQNTLRLDMVVAVK